MSSKFKSTIEDILWAIIAGFIVGCAYYFFQNSNGFAPGGIGGLATITYHIVGDFMVSVAEVQNLAGGDASGRVQR